VNLHALREKVCRRLVARALDRGEDAARRSDDRLLTLDELAYHRLRGGHALFFFYRA
jgi:hypothetical protein